MPERTPDQREDDPQPRSALRDTAYVAGVHESWEIGTAGPVIASRAIHRAEADPELRKFEVLFGRDALRTALDLLDDYPQLARTTIIALAQRQGLGRDPTVSEEAPGKIHHEERTKGDTKFDHLRPKWGYPDTANYFLYYGSVDATPLWLKLVADYVAATGDRALLQEEFEPKRWYRQPNPEHRRLLDAVRLASDWILEELHTSQSGLLEHSTKNPQGHQNPVWQDSWDAYSHADGSWPNTAAPRAAIEVQGYAYDGLQGAAHLFRQEAAYAEKEDQRALIDRANVLDAAARELQLHILRAFWNERLGYFAPMLDYSPTGQLRQLEVVKSTPGHLLNSGILSGGDPLVQDRREAVIRTLFGPDLFATAGIRTTGESSPRFNPGAYHNGSVWPSDNAFIADGLERQGYPGLANHLRLRLLWAVNSVGKFVEFLRGEQGQEPRINTRIVHGIDERTGQPTTVEKLPQEIQAWTASAVLKVKRRHGREQLTGAFDVLAKDPEKRQLESDILDRLHRDALEHGWIQD